MAKIYTIEDAKTRMQESVNFYKYRIEAWENVQRLHKKNGEDFAILSKNFENCRFYKEWSHDVLAVYFRCPMPNGGTKYESDTVWLDGNEYAGRERQPLSSAHQPHSEAVLLGLLRDGSCKRHYRNGNQEETARNARGTD